MFFNQGRFGDTDTHIEHAKLYAVASNEVYFLAFAMQGHAPFWFGQRTFEDAAYEASCPRNVFEKLGATDLAEGVREFLWWIELGEEID